MQSSWLFYSLCATLLFGISSTLFKLPSAKGHNRYATGIWNLVTAGTIAGGALLFYPAEETVAQVTPLLLLLAAIWGIALACMNPLQMYCLSKLETNAHYPVATSGSLIGTILLGLLLFNDHISGLQWLGIGLVIITIYLFVYHRGSSATYTPPLIAAIASLITFSVITKLAANMAVEAGMHLPTFQAFQYLFASGMAVLMYAIVHRKDIRRELFSGMRVGIAIGCISVTANMFYLHALTIGPFQLVNAIHSLYIIATSYFGVLFLQERLTKRKITLLALAVASIIIVRIG
jgi:drug/metabolite transporter (DMT)-like permease